MLWHPPVPAGIATSDAIRDLQYKTAIQLLLYCYDDVRPEGWVKINLKEAASALHEPYETVRRWWRELRSGPFFCEQIDRGRSGWMVRFSEDWVDWHVLSTNYERSPMNVENRSIKAERSSMNGENENIDLSSTFQRSPMNDNDQRNKVLMSDQNPERERTHEDRDRTERAVTLSHPAVTAYRQAFPHIPLNQKQEAIIKRVVGDGVERLECWRETIEDYELSTVWKPENLGNMRNRFEQKLADRQREKARPAQANGHKPTRPPTDLPLTVADPNKKIRSAEERRRILNEVKVNDTS